MIHLYQNNGYNIVLDVNSGSVHVVDELAYDVIGFLEKDNPLHTVESLREEGTKAKLFAAFEDGYTLTNPKGSPAPQGHELRGTLGYTLASAERSPAPQGHELRGALGYTWEDVCDVLEAVIELTKEGRLFTRDVYEDFIDVVKQRKTVVKALCLHIAHDCNLACKYCFAEEGEYHGRRALMSFEVGKKALDFLIANSGSRRNLEVDFFGGEPLMNWQVVKDLVAYGREQEKLHDKHFRFTLTTNGVLLDEEVQEFVNKEMDNVVLSLDGRKEVNDRMRPFRNGKGSYDLIVPKFQRLAESRGQQKYYIRGTFTRQNLDFAKDVMHFVDLGFEQISIEPVVGEDSDPYAIRKCDLPDIFREYDVLAKTMVERERAGKGFTFFHFMIDLEGGPCVSKRLSGCGSGTEYLAVTPWGDLYPCHQFVGQEEFLMGNVDEGITKPEIADEFRSCSVYSKEKCRNCFAKFYCSGGCMANSYKFHQTIHDTYDVSCEMERKRVECAIMIKAALAEA